MKTPLFERHCQLGAKIVDFCGWEMPIQYKGIIQEHNAVRNRVGIFDVSHMGRIAIEGKQAESFLEYLSTNEISEKSNFSATYTILISSSGGCIDDVIIYKINSQNFFIVVNACNRQKDLNHLLKYKNGFDVKIEDCFHEEGILAIQGPHSEMLLTQFFPFCSSIKFMNFIATCYQEEEIFLSRTGYTGAGGFEIYGSKKKVIDIWDQCLKEGKSLGIEPIGLGARDTLRLEKGYALYGHEINETISPIESVSAWTVKKNKGDFLGKEALLALENSSTKRSEYGIEILEKGIAREGYEVYKNDILIGKVTSGTYSPTLEKAIALILVNKNLNPGDIVHIKIRQNLIEAKVVNLPFL
jgi:aminomethyltransferase